MDVQATLTKKIGPLPIWAIGLLMVGGYLWIRHRNAADTADGTVPADETIAGADQFPAFSYSGPPGVRPDLGNGGCPAGYYRDDNGDCQPLPIIATEKCPDGYYRDKMGDCVPLPDKPGPCPKGFHRDDSGDCVPDVKFGPPPPSPGPIKVKPIPIKRIVIRDALRKLLVPPKKHKPKPHLPYPPKKKPKEKMRGHGAMYE